MSSQTPTADDLARNPFTTGAVPAETATDFKDTWLGRLHNRRVVESDNDLLVAVSASSKSAVSGVGKTTLGIKLCRHFDVTEHGWDADKSTLSSDEFTDSLLQDKERVPNQSSVLFDEAQGTLSGDGADARRGMASSVMDISKGMATLRYRQISTVIVTQSPDWIDKRVRNLLDALILIQEPGQAEVFDVYKNDLDTNSREYTEHKQTLFWDPLPDGDPDYQRMHAKKEQSAERGKESDSDNDQGLSKDAQMQIAQAHRDVGRSLQWIADNVDKVDFSRETIRKNTVASDDE